MFVKIVFTALRSVHHGRTIGCMSTNLDTKLGRRRMFRGRAVPTPPPAEASAPLGYDVESRMLDEMFRMGRIGRPGYELARRQLQKTYGVGVLPDSSVRDA